MGLRKSVFDMAFSLVALMRTRLELLALEATREKARLVSLLGMSLAAWLFLSLALLVFSVSMVIAFLPAERLWLVLGLLALVYGVIGVALLYFVRRNLRTQALPFSATLEELKRDVALFERLRDTQKADRANFAPEGEEN
jgi:uncharacterized membrane protein YqjE